MHLFLNGLAASAGGALTYLKNVVPHLSSQAGTHTTIAAPPFIKQEFGMLPRITFTEIPNSRSVAHRFLREQTVLHRLIRESGAHVLLSTGNIALRKSPIPQILLSRNSLYTSPDFFRDLRARRDYRLWIDTKIKGILAKQSISWAECTVAPSQAFAEDLRTWTGREVVTIHHGFDASYFCQSSEPLPRDIEDTLYSHRNAVRLLFVSHYNYYRNFETLLSALPLISKQLTNRRVVLFLTCKLAPNGNANQYHMTSASSLVRNLGIADQVVELGAISYQSLHHLYRACDVYVTPAYAETFAHPLLEAMASGLPVVAADIPVHREICHNAALYFDRFSPAELADQVRQVLSSDEARRQMSKSGIERSSDFSWEKHAKALFDLSRLLLTRVPRPISVAFNMPILPE